MTAEAIGISVSSVQRIWRAHGLQPDRVRQFKLSNDPKFVDKLRDPPAPANVLSLDEKSQIQALDRTQPGLPLKRGRAGTMTHDCKRHSTTTVFAALNVLDGTVIGRNMQRHRHQEFNPVRDWRQHKSTRKDKRFSMHKSHGCPRVVRWVRSATACHFVIGEIF
jgi:hypothetical protein